MQQQFTKVSQILLAIIAVATIASLATAVVTLSRSEDGAGSSSVSQGALGTQLGAATAVDESARVTLVIPARSTRGTAALNLSIGEAGSSFRATAQIKGKGLVDKKSYGMWLSAPDGNTLLIGTAQAEEDKAEEECEAGECDTVLKLRSSSQEVPLSLTTLEGLTITISEDLSSGSPNIPNITLQVESTAPPPFASATVTAADISG